jgi:N utilization substance protein B
MTPLQIEVTVDKKLIRAQQKARKLALQALYQWHMSGTDLHEIDAQFRTLHDSEKIDIEFFSNLLHAIPACQLELEAQFTPFLDRDIATLNPIELTLIRMGTFELMKSLNIPYKVVLDEAVTLAKEFGSQEGHRYVNGILNKVAREVRAAEVSMHG